MARSIHKSCILLDSGVVNTSGMWEHLPQSLSLVHPTVPDGVSGLTLLVASLLPTPLTISIDQLTLPTPTAKVWRVVPCSDLRHNHSIALEESTATSSQTCHVPTLQRCTDLQSLLPAVHPIQRLPSSHSTTPQLAAACSRERSVMV